MDRGHEAAPLYVNGTLYVITPWPNILFALDAKTADPFVTAEGLLFVSDWNAGMHVLEYKG